MDRDDPTLTTVTIASSNTIDPTTRLQLDTVTLTITPSETINQPTVVFTSNNDAITNSDSITYSNTTGDIWTASYRIVMIVVVVGFTITYSDLAGN